MALVTLSVKRRGSFLGKQAENMSTAEDQCVESTLIYAVPSLCKKAGITDGQVNSKVLVLYDKDVLELYCTQTVATIAGLT